MENPTRQTLSSWKFYDQAVNITPSCLTEKWFLQANKGLNQCVDWGEKRLKYSRGNQSITGGLVCVCVEGEPGRVIWLSWTDSFEQEITSAVSGG